MALDQTDQLLRPLAQQELQISVVSVDSPRDSLQTQSAHDVRARFPYGHGQRRSPEARFLVLERDLGGQDRGQLVVQGLLAHHGPSVDVSRLRGWYASMSFPTACAWGLRITVDADTTS